jgi:hypothetical protein
VECPVLPRILTDGQSRPHFYSPPFCATQSPGLSRVPLGGWILRPVVAIALAC